MSLRELLLLLQTTWRVSTGRGSFRRGGWPLVRAARLLLSRPRLGMESRGWGFKEPNSHVFLESLASSYPDLRFIYVLRHGLDMAFSENLNQLFSWGEHYGVAAPADEAELPAAQLDYWIAATERVQEAGARLLGERFLVLRYEELFPEPREQLARLASFLSVEESCLEGPRIAEITRPSASMGRYRGRDLGLFSESQLRRVEELGYEVVR